VLDAGISWPTAERRRCTREQCGSDEGSNAAAAKVLKATWQCCVHLMRNVLARAQWRAVLDVVEVEAVDV